MTDQSRKPGTRSPGFRGPTLASNARSVKQAELCASRAPKGRCPTPHPRSQPRVVSGSSDRSTANSQTSQQPEPRFKAPTRSSTARSMVSDKGIPTSAAPVTTLPKRRCPTPHPRCQPRVVSDSSDRSTASSRTSGQPEPRFQAPTKSSTARSIVSANGTQTPSLVPGHSAPTAKPSLAQHLEGMAAAFHADAQVRARQARPVKRSDTGRSDTGHATGRSTHPKGPSRKKKKKDLLPTRPPTPAPTGNVARPVLKPTLPMSPDKKPSRLQRFFRKMRGTTTNSSGQEKSGPTTQPPGEAKGVDWGWQEHQQGTKYYKATTDNYWQDGECSRDRPVRYWFQDMYLRLSKHTSKW
jgi:hypothetical protein